MEKLDRSKTYTLEEAIKFLKENKVASFYESVEVHLRTNIDPKKTDQQLRGTTELPHGTGKTKKIVVITTTHAKEAKEAGADAVVGDEFIEKIKSGKAFAGKENFDVLVATPEMMPKLAPVAKILGPKGLMPNPKTETVTTKIKETVAALKAGKVAFKNDNSAIVHQAVGKLSFDDVKLIENIRAFAGSLEKFKPTKSKGKLITRISLSSTMGVGIRVSL